MDQIRELPSVITDRLRKKVRREYILDVELVYVLHAYPNFTLIDLVTTFQKKRKDLPICTCYGLLEASSITDHLSSDFLSNVMMTYMKHFANKTGKLLADTRPQAKHHAFYPQSCTVLYSSVFLSLSAYANVWTKWNHN